MRKTLSLVLLLFAGACVSSGPDPFLVDIQERTQKVDVLLQGEKKAREKLARQVSALAEKVQVLQETLDRERALSASREAQRKRDWSLGWSRLEGEIAGLRENTAKTLRALALQARTALEGLARLEKGLGGLRRAQEETARLAGENNKALRGAEAGRAALEKNLASLEKGAARAAAERAGILARLEQVERKVEGLPARFPRPKGKERLSGIESRLARVESSVKRLERLWEEDVRGILSGLADSLRSRRGEAEALAKRLDLLEKKVQAASMRGARRAMPPSSVPASKPVQKVLAQSKAGAGRAAGELPLPLAAGGEQENPWDPVTGLGTRTWPWLVGMGAFLFLLLVWALKGNGSGAEVGETAREEGTRDGGRETLESPGKPASSTGVSPPRSSSQGPALFPGARAPGPDGELPPTRVMAELAPGGEGSREEDRIREALRILETSPLCLADPEVQVEPDKETGKVRIFFWVPGFATPEEIRELASRVESL